MPFFWETLYFGSNDKILVILPCYTQIFYQNIILNSICGKDYNRIKTSLSQSKDHTDNKVNNLHRLMNHRKSLVVLLSSITSNYLSRAYPSCMLYKPVYHRSYWKSMKIRRRIKTKKRTVSAKKLQEEKQQGFNFANQIKILDIKKQLDKKTEVNHQIYQLVEDLYFPDIRIQSYETAQLSIKDKVMKFSVQEADQITKQLQTKTLATQLLQVFLKYEKGFFKQQNQFQKLQKKYAKIGKEETVTDETTKQDSPDSQELVFNRQNINNKFQLQHYELLVAKVCKYLKGLPAIKDKYMKRYEQILSRVKDAQRGITKKKTKIKCPYQFFDAEDLGRYKPWKQFIQSFIKRIQQYKQTEEETQIQQPSQQSIQKQKEEDIYVMVSQKLGQEKKEQLMSDLKAEMVSTLLRQIKIVLDLQWNFKQVPELLYKSIIGKIVDFYEQEIFQIQKMKGQQLNQLIRPFTIQKFVKLQQQLVIPDPISNETMHATVAKLIHSIIMEFVRVPQKRTINCLNSIISFNYIQECSSYLTPQILNHLKPIILKNLSNISFEKSVSNFDNYLQIGIGDINNSIEKKKGPAYEELMELLLFDLIRKAQYCKNPRYLLRVLSWINQRKIKLLQQQNRQSYIEAMPLLVKIGQVLPSFYIPSNINKMADSIQYLNSKHIYQILECYFKNRVAGDSWIAQLQLLANQVVKKLDQYSLEELADICLMIRLLSISFEDHNQKISPNTVITSFRILAELVAHRFVKEYHQKKQQYRQERVYLLTDSNQKERQNRKKSTEVQQMSKKEVNLQECRLIVLWNYVIALLQDDRIDSRLDTLLTLYPSASEDIFSFKDSNTKAMYLKKYYQPMMIQMLNQINNVLSPFDLFPKFSTSIIKPATKKVEAAPNIAQAFNTNFGEIIVRKWEKYYEPNFVKSQARKLLQLQALQTGVFIKGFNIVQNISIPERWSTSNKYLKELMSKKVSKKELKIAYYDLENYKRWLIEMYSDGQEITKSFFQSNFYQQLSNISLSSQLLRRRQAFAKELTYVNKQESNQKTQIKQSGYEKKQFRYYQLE